MKCVLTLYDRNSNEIGKVYPLRMCTREGVPLENIKTNAYDEDDFVTGTICPNSYYIKSENFGDGKYTIFFDLKEYLRFTDITCVFDHNPEHVLWGRVYLEFVRFLKILEGIYVYFSSDDYLNIIKQFFDSYRRYTKTRRGSMECNIYEIKFKNFYLAHNISTDGDFSNARVLTIEKENEKREFFPRIDKTSILNKNFANEQKIKSEAKDFLKELIRDPLRCYRGRGYSSFVIRNIIVGIYSRK